jgi:hypothetical protein
MFVCMGVVLLRGACCFPVLPVRAAGLRPAPASPFERPAGARGIGRNREDGPTDKPWLRG